MTFENTSRLILSDWAAFGETIPTDRQRLLEELLILSLVYDEILIQDETLVLNVTFANQFASAESFQVIEQLIETGALVVLTHPLHLYPEMELRERATAAPMETRAEYITKYGTSGERQFFPSDKQKEFYKRLDHCLQKNKQSHRHVSDQTLGGRDIMEAFASLLDLVLKDQKNYGKWLRSAFQGVSDNMRTEYLKCIDNPSKAYERIHHLTGKAKAVTRNDGSPVFNRSLGYQLSATFSKKEAESMQCLIQTIFAAPFGLREGATGRYNNYLREFLAVPSDVDAPATTRNHVSVIANVATGLHLPSTDQKFCDTIQNVRTGKAGKNLRSAMRMVGEDYELARLNTCWNTVADELARHYHSNDPISIRSVLCTFGKSLASATISESIKASLTTPPTDIASMISSGLWGLTGEGILLGGSLIAKSLRQDLKYQQLRKNIEMSLSIRCSDISVPQALLGCPINNGEKNDTKNIEVVGN